MEQRHNVSAEGKFHAPEHSLVQGPLISILCAAAEVSNLDQICTVPPTEGGLLAFFLGLDLLLLLDYWPGFVVIRQPQPDLRHVG